MGRGYSRPAARTRPQRTSRVSHYMEVYCDFAQAWGSARTVPGTPDTSAHFCQFCGGTDHPEVVV